MQDERVLIPKNDENVVSKRIEHLIESLGDLWQHPYEPSPEKLKGIIEFVVHLPEPYRAAGMTKIAEHLVNNMGLHFLNIMATFQQKAEQEGIDQKEREETFHDIMPELFLTMMGLSRNISVQSLDDLVTLSNITFGLYRLSQVDSAVRAQRWMYKLPKLYHRQLALEHLVTSAQAQLTVTIHPATMQPMAGQPQVTVTIHPTPTLIAAGQPQLTVTIDSTTTQVIDSTISGSATTLVA